MDFEELFAATEEISEEGRPHSENKFGEQARTDFNENPLIVAGFTYELVSQFRHRPEILDSLTQSTLRLLAMQAHPDSNIDGSRLSYSSNKSVFAAISKFKSEGPTTEMIKDHLAQFGHQTQISERLEEAANKDYHVRQLEYNSHAILLELINLGESIASYKECEMKLFSSAWMRTFVLESNERINQLIDDTVNSYDRCLIEGRKAINKIVAESLREIFPAFCYVRNFSTELLGFIERNPEARAQLERGIENYRAMSESVGVNIERELSEIADNWPRSMVLQDLAYRRYIASLKNEEIKTQRVEIISSGMFHGAHSVTELFRYSLNSQEDILDVTYIQDTILRTSSPESWRNILKYKENSLKKFLKVSENELEEHRKLLRIEAAIAHAPNEMAAVLARVPESSQWMRKRALSLPISRELVPPEDFPPALQQLFDELYNPRAAADKFLSTGFDPINSRPRDSNREEEGKLSDEAEARGIREAESHFLNEGAEVANNFRLVSNDGSPQLIQENSGATFDILGFRYLSSQISDRYKPSFATVESISEDPINIVAQLSRALPEAKDISGLEPIEVVVAGLDTSGQLVPKSLGFIYSITKRKSVSADGDA